MHDMSVPVHIYLLRDPMDHMNSMDTALLTWLMLQFKNSFVLQFINNHSKDVSKKFQYCSFLCDKSQNFSFLEFRPATLLKKRLWHRCFPVNFVKFIRTFF